MTARVMRNPEKWIGKKAQSEMRWEQHCDIIDKCDDCQKFARADELHSLLCPLSDADFELQDAVGTEDAETYCPECLEWFENRADEIDPEWRARQVA